MPATRNATATPPQHVKPKLCYPEHEAAELLGISVRTLFNLRAEGKIAYVKLGARILYRASALRHFLRDHETPATTPAPAEAAALHDPPIRTAAPGSAADREKDR